MPDPVFAQKMVGDGVSIDPTSATLLAPCEGEIVQLHSAGHALTIRTPLGVEVMVHVGLDTVQLGGEGFTPRVAVGDRVATGTPLLDFDADFVATHARSLLTQIVVTTPGRVDAVVPRQGTVVAGRDPVLEVIVSASASARGVDAADTVISEPVDVLAPTGWHARPAAVLANAARAFAADITLLKGTARANAKSVVAIMGLEVTRGDRVQVAAAGPDAAAAVAALAPLIASGLGEETPPAPAVPPGTPPGARPAEDTATARPGTGSVLPDVFRGVTASPGVAVGRIVRVRRARPPLALRGTDPREERRRLERAVEQARAGLQALQARLCREADAAKAAIFAAQEALLADPDLLEVALAGIAAGQSAAFAWDRAVAGHADRLAGLTNERLAARANDLRDVGERVQRALSGETTATDEVPAESILVAEDLTPSETATLDRSRVVGFCTTGGGATSHVAILARALDIPALVATDPRVLALTEGTPAVLDASAGALRVNPPADVVARVGKRQQRHRARRAADLAHAMEPAVTRDGVRVEVAANIGSLADVEQAVRLGAEGVGLLRAEFLFLNRRQAPSEDEQATVFGDVAAALGPGRPVIVRALDVGGDKPLSYLPLPHEDNPFLGERGIRVLLAHEAVFRTQLRAMLRASSRGTVRVMFPMVSRLEEWRTAKAWLEEERRRLGVPPVQAGLMVEVPAAALLSEHFAAEADFFSIGTNDLTQYTLAMDRGHPKLAPLVDGLEPSVLQLIARTVGAARARGKWVGVCGAIAADPQAIPLLVGLGVDELSVGAEAIPGVKARVRALDAAQCRALAERALTLGTAAEVRALVPVDE